MWQQTVAGLDRCPSLSENREADVVIVGGGITGLSSALHLCELGKSVILLEAQEIAWGGSGRTAGRSTRAGK